MKRTCYIVICPVVKEGEGLGRLSTLLWFRPLAMQWAIPVQTRGKPCTALPLMPVTTLATGYHDTEISTPTLAISRHCFPHRLRQQTDSNDELNNKCTNKLCGRPPQYAPAPCKLIFDLLTLNVVSTSHVTWPTSVPILVFLGLSVLDLGLMYATDRRQTRIIA